MATQKQREANRRNASRSTGPRTEAGKQRTRFNALRHGLAAQSPVLPHEDDAAFEEMRAALIASYEPANLQELQLIDHIAHAQLRMERARRFENGMLDLQLRHSKRMLRRPVDPSPGDDTGIAAAMCSPEFELGYKTLFRYDSRAEASYFKAVNSLHRVREARLRREKSEAKRSAQAADSSRQTAKLASFGQAEHIAPVEEIGAVPVIAHAVKATAFAGPGVAAAKFPAPFWKSDSVATQIAPNISPPQQI
jgi:hypothetical protein